MTGAARVARVVLGVSGGIAAYKACTLLRLLTESGHDVTVVPTAAALRFVGEPTWSALSGKPVHTDVWSDADQVPHVRLGREADLVVVAPATADLLARAAHGLADDLLTNVLLTARCPVLLAPAMHTEMWQHPATVANVATLRSRGVQVLDPAVGRLTGADTGPGRLPEPDDLYAACLAALAARPAAPPLAAPPLAAPPLVAPEAPFSGPPTLKTVLPEQQAGNRAANRAANEAGNRAGEGTGELGALAGRQVVVSAGGTREPLDPVRFLGNRSSGKQGYALAEVAAARGAHVTLVSASPSLPAPAGVEVVAVETALELQEAVTKAAVDADVVVMAAAVADFRPARYATAKIKKSHASPADDSAPTVELVRNPDVLAGLVHARGEALLPVVVGFAAETGDQHASVLDLATEKLDRKGCDLLVANEVGVGLTFGQDITTVHVLRRDEHGTLRVTDAGPASKAAVAAKVWDVIQDELAVRLPSQPV
ncbi:MAG TPA: bifunctional phosphopantothenoylcysteine decarboxylase/phosphopantothenate synthase [Dermatophilaceae bacterium]|nr:bifunctional phosphopantothenoylcysteine decarboxylase/phosphopantothenate synthase [Dermatophilaceae bacterium]